MAGTLGGKITLDISEFTKNITRANQLIRENESQWRQSASTIGDWTKSEEGLNSRITTLNKQIEQQKNILGVLNEKKRVLIEEYGLESKQVDAVNKEIAKYGKALDSSYKEQNSIISSLEKLTKTQKSDNVSRETLTKTIDKQTTEVKEQKTAQDKLNTSVEKATQGYTILKNVIANLITNGLQKMTISLRNVANLVNTLPANTETTRKSLIQLETAFQNAGFSADTARTAYVNFKAVLGNATSDINTSASLIADLSKNESDLYEWSNLLIGVYAQLGNAFPTQELLKNIQQTANTGKSTENLTKILDNAGYSSAEFYNTLSKMTTQEERLAFIQDTLNELYGESGKIYQKNNRELIESAQATERQQLALSRFGDALQPVKTQFTEAKTDVLNSLADLLKGVDGAESDLSYSIGYLLGSVANTFGELKNLITPVWSTVKTSLGEWWENNKEDLKTSVKDKVALLWSGVTTSLGAWWGENGDNLKTTVKDGIKDLFDVKEADLTGILKTGLFATLLLSLLTGGKATMLLAGAGLLGYIIDGMTDEENEGNKSKFAKVAEHVGKKLQTAIREWAEDKDFFKEFFTFRYGEEERAKIAVRAQNLADDLTDSINEGLNNGLDFSTALENAVDKLDLNNIITEPIQEQITETFNKELVINPKLKVNYTIEEIAESTPEELETKKAELKNALLPALTIDDFSDANRQFMTGVISDLGETAFNNFVAGFTESEKQGTLTVTLKNLLEKTKIDLEQDEGFLTACGNIASVVWTGIKLGFETFKIGTGTFIDKIKQFFGVSDKNANIGPQARNDEIRVLGTVASTGGNAVADLIKADTETTVVDSFVAGWTDGLEGKQSVLRTAVIETTESALNESTEEIEENATESFSEMLGRLWTNLKSSLPNLTNEIRNTVTDLLDFAGDFNPDDTTESITNKMYSSLSASLKNLGGHGELAGFMLDLFDGLTNMSDEELDQWAENLANMLMESLINIINDLPRIVDFALTLMKELGIALAKSVPALLANLPDIIGEILDALIKSIPDFAQIGAELIKGLFSGMFDFVKNGWNLIKEIGNSIVEGFKSIFGIHSPSKVFADNIGKNISLGIAQGIADNVGAINASLNDVETGLTVTGSRQSGNNGIVVNQYNTYSRQHSRYELYKTRKDTYNAVKGAIL